MFLCLRKVKTLGFHSITFYNYWLQNCFIEIRLTLSKDPSRSGAGSTICCQIFYQKNIKFRIQNQKVFFVLNRRIAYVKPFTNKNALLRLNYLYKQLYYHSAAQQTESTFRGSPCIFDELLAKIQYRNTGQMKAPQ